VRESAHAGYQFLFQLPNPLFGGIAALVPVGSAPEVSHKRTEPQRCGQAGGTYLHGLNGPGIIGQFHKLEVIVSATYTKRFMDQNFDLWIERGFQIKAGSEQ
jgi:hypothetical protein